MIQKGLEHIKESHACRVVTLQSCSIFPSLRRCHAAFVQITLSKYTTSCKSVKELKRTSKIYKQYDHVLT